MEERKRTFKDAEGREWTPRLTAQAIFNVSAETGIKLSDLTRQDIRPGDLIVLLWRCCEKQAEGRKLSREDFLDSLEVSHIAEGVKAIWGSVESAFPGAADGLKGFPGLAQGPGPASPGK